MYISLLFVTNPCFSMVLKSMKYPDLYFVSLEYNVNSIKRFQTCQKSIHSLLHFCVGVQWHAVVFK